MAVRKVPAWPKGVAGNVWANKLSDAQIYCVEGEDFNYDTGTAVTVFAIPEDTVLLGIGLQVTTAFDKPGGSLTVQDTLADICIFGQDVLADSTTRSGYSFQPVYKVYPKFGTEGKQSRLIQIDVNGGTGTAGVGRLTLWMKPNRAFWKPDNIA